jgi:hypothetical protein
MISCEVIRNTSSPRSAKLIRAKQVTISAAELGGYSAMTAATKGRLMFCTVLGLTLNRAPVLRTLMPPARAAWMRSCTSSAIGPGRPSRFPSRLARRSPRADSFLNDRALELGKNAHHAEHCLPVGVRCVTLPESSR